MKKQLAALGLATILASTSVGVAYAAQTSKMTQIINAGVLSFDNKTSGGESVAPSFALSAATVNTGTYSTTTGTYGDATNGRATVDNPGVATTITLSLGATTPSVGWTKDGTTQAYPFNGASASAGQLSLTSSGTTGTNAGTAPSTLNGASTGAYSGTTPKTILSASNASAFVWNGYVQGIGVSQTIPAGTPAGNYYIDMTMTIAST